MPPALTARRVLIIVENEAALTDHRVSKQIATLLQAGYFVSAISRTRHGRGEFWQHPRLRLLEYPAPAEPRGRLGYLAEYGYSLLAATCLSLRVLARGRPGVVQFCQPPDLYFPLALVFRRLGIRVLVDQRDLLPELYVARYGAARPGLLKVLGRLERLSQRRADRIICVNDYLRERLLAASGAPQAHVRVIRNGPVLARVTGVPADEALRRGRRYLCCWVGVMGRQDRLDLLIRSIDYLVHKLGRRDCTFAIIGFGESRDGAQRLARELGLAEWVTFTGALAFEDVFRYLASADLGLDASLQFEVSPVKVMEYMAFGVPVVAFNLPETRAIADGAAAWAEPGDVAGHAGAIDALLRDPRRREELGRAGRARVRDDLAWEHQAVRYLDIIGQLLARPGG